MDLADFLSQANAVLSRVEGQMSRISDDGEADIEVSRSGNVLTLEFEDASRIILNLQEPMHELWLAARAGGFHFRFDGTHWRDTRSGGEFYEALSQRISEQAGMPVRISA